MGDDQRSGRAAGLRVSHTDRRKTVELLDTALDEGRLDSDEHDIRVRAAQGAKMSGDLATLMADLPDRSGVWEWAGHLRVRATDRQRAEAWLADALAAGALDVEEHQRRLAEVAAAVTYESLKESLDGVPGPPDTVRERLFVTAADRDRVTSRLALALADGRIGADDHAEIQTAVAAAERYGELDRASAALDEHTRPDLRAEVTRRLDEAYAGGQLEAAEHERRVTAARQAARNADLQALLDGLTEPVTGVTPEWIVGRAPSKLARHVLSDADREQAARALERALREGRLDRDEYDERVRDAYAAKEATQLRPLLVDLVAPRSRGRLRGILAVVVAMAVIGTLTVVAWNSGGSEGTEVVGVDAAPPVMREQLEVRWAAERDRPTEIQAVGNWVEGATLIRARTDRVTAYAIATGRVKWTFAVPGRDHICTMSREIEQGVGLIGFGPDDHGVACTTVAALDLRTGQLLWQRRRTVAREHTTFVSAVDDEVGIAAGVAVIKEPAGFVAVGLRDNQQMWHLPVAAPCEAYSVTASGTDVALLSACDDRTARLSMVEPSSGQIRFGVDLRLHEDDHLFFSADNLKSTIVLSTTPLVVRTTDDGTRTHDAIFSFDAQGRRRATIPLSQDDFDLAPNQFLGSSMWGGLFLARRPHVFAVVGDTFIAPVRMAGGTHEDRLAAFSLVDGRRLWQVKLSGVVAASDRIGERFVVATSDAKIHVLSTADGRILATTPVTGLPATMMPGSHELRITGDRYAISNQHGTGDWPPALALG